MDIEQVVSDRIESIAEILKGTDPHHDSLHRGGSGTYMDLDRSLLQWVSMALAIKQNETVK